MTYRFSKSIMIHGFFALVIRQLDCPLDLSPSTATSLEVPPHPEFGAICTGFPSAKLGASVVADIFNGNKSNETRM